MPFVLTTGNKLGQGRLIDGWRVPVCNRARVGQWSRQRQANAEGTAAFTLTNTGKPAEGAADHLTNDVCRLSVSVEGTGWRAGLQNALAAVKAGSMQPVQVFIAKDADATASARVTLTATSESDPTKSVKATYTVRR